MSDSGKAITPFQRWVAQRQDFLYEQLPQMAVGDGIHGRDAQLGGYQQTQIESLVSRLKAFDAQLEEEILPQLAPAEHLDYQIARTNNRRWIWYFETFRRWARDPQYYADVLSHSWLGQVLFPWASAPVRLGIITEQLKQVDSILEAARKNLQQVPPVYLRYGQEQYAGMLSLLERDLPAAFQSVQDEALQSRFHQAAQKASESIRRFLDYLDEDLKPRAKADFALGREEFQKVLQLGEMVPSDAESLAELAEHEIQRAHRRWESLAARIDPYRSPQDLWRKLQHDHPAGGTLPAAAESQLEALREFLKQPEIVPVPERLQIQVLPTPEFFRWSFASMWTPGPYETTPMKSTYYITDVLADWTEEQKEQHLSGFNYGNLWMVTIHEVFPGHGVQLAWLPDVPSPVRKSRLFSCTAYIEGWAHYSEELMLEVGFSQRDPRIEAGQIAEALIRLCRTVAAVRMHLGQMSLDSAARLFVEQGWMSEQSGRREAERGTFDPDYCLYTIGKWQLQGLRQLLRRENTSFWLSDFHRRILTGGVAPWPIYQQELCPNPSDRSRDLVRVFADEVAPVEPTKRWTG